MFAGGHQTRLKNKPDENQKKKKKTVQSVDSSNNEIRASCPLLAPSQRIAPHSSAQFADVNPAEAFAFAVAPGQRQRWRWYRSQDSEHQSSPLDAGLDAHRRLSAAIWTQQHVVVPRPSLRPAVRHWRRASLLLWWQIQAVDQLERPGARRMYVVFL